MFDWFFFWRTFGFFSSRFGDEIDEKIVKTVLASLETYADIRRKSMEDLEGGYFSSDVNIPVLLGKRSTLKIAMRVHAEAEERLRRACQLAAKYGFQPVSRYQHLVRSEEIISESEPAPAV